MAKETCFTSIRKLFPKEEVPDKFIRDVLGEVEGLRRRYKKDGKKAYNKAVADNIKRWREIYRVDKSARISAAKASARLQIDAKEFGPFKAMKRILSGDGVGKNQRVHIDVMSEVAHKRYLQKLTKGLEDLDAINIMRDGSLDKEIMIEMDHIAKTGKYGKTGNESAGKIASILRSLNDEMHADMRRHGMRVGYLEDFIVSQSHAKIKLLPAGVDKAVAFREWREFIEPLLDPDRTFTGALKGNKGRQEKYLREVFDKLTEHGDRDGLGKGLTPLGIRNLTQREIHVPRFSSRSLHFKDGDAFFNYNQRFGERNLMESFQHSMRKSAQLQAFVEALGPDPDTMFKDFLRRYNDQLSTPEKVELRNIWRNLTGKVNEGSDSMVAKSFSIKRALLNAALLGKATISALPDFAIAISKMKTISGDNFFTTSQKLFNDYIALATSPGERQKMATMIEIFAEGLLGETYSRLGMGIEGGSSVAANITRYTFKLNGLEWHTNNAKWAYGLTLASEFHTRLDTNYGDLPPRFRKFLNAYGLDHKDWGALQKLNKADPELFNVNGRGMVSPGAVRGINPNLADKLAMAYTDSANIAIPTPGARQRAAANQGLEAGTWAGQLMRTLGHLKSFPLTVLRSVDNIIKSAAPVGMDARLRDALKTKEGLMATGELMVAATALGGLALMAKDVIAGKEPRDVFTGEGLVDSFIQGGAGGLYADLIFGAYDVPGRSFTSALLGPTGALVDDAAKAYAELRDGDPKKAGKNAVKAAMRRIPGQNLFYLEAGLRYMVLDNLNEALNPGYRNRRLNRMRQQPALFSDDGVDSLLEF